MVHILKNFYILINPIVIDKFSTLPYNKSTQVIIFLPEKVNMKSLKTALVLVISFVALNSTSFASCNGSGYGSSGSCEEKNPDYDLQKRVKKTNDGKKEQKITGIKKGETFIYTFKVENSKNEKETLKLVDNLPNELERVSGIGFTEEIILDKKSSKTLEMVVKVKDSEFENKTNFEKCVVNKAFLKKGDIDKDSSTATVCYGAGSANNGTSSISTLPKTGANEMVLGLSVLSITSGLILKKFKK